MKLNLCSFLLALAVLACFMGMSVIPCQAAPIVGIGLPGLNPALPELTLSVETPILHSPGVPWENTTSISGTLSLPLDFDGRFRVFGAANYGFGDRGVDRCLVSLDDLWRGGLACDLNRYLTAYCYYEQRFSLADKPDRIMAGLTFRTQFGN